MNTNDFPCRRRSIVVATKNKGKAREIAQILSIPQIDFISLTEVTSDDYKVEEIFNTYYENALLKAIKASEATGLPSIADDSGLEVDALDGAPGVISSCFSGVEGDDEKNIQKLLNLLKDEPEANRTARFRCIAVAYFPDEEVILSSEGVCEGKVISEKRGTGGFGYDPVFVPEGYEITFAEMDLALKNKISHRAKAFRLLRRKLIDFLEI
ncbi:MAG: RdgB/HAM1 family non-canonical purine NTP pyrophosphatase [Actinobacteria bacterium]|nr:RdgB/HAM1 family non-canonical purine NTP pyrophosphatase [Actinomycetota bacterium]